MTVRPGDVVPIPVCPSCGRICCPVCGGHAVSVPLLPEHYVCEDECGWSGRLARIDQIAGEKLH